jgi:hypothetical protein
VAVSAWYPLAKQSFLTQSPSINMSSGNVKVRAVDITVDYTYSAAHQFASSVPKYGSTTDQLLGSKSFTGGIFDAADATFSSVVASGTKTVGALVIFLDLGGADAANPLIMYIQDGIVATPPNGSDIAIGWDNGTNKIAAL